MLLDVITAPDVNRLH